MAHLDQDDIEESDAGRHHRHHFVLVHVTV